MSTQAAVAGTNDGRLMGFPPTGRRVSIDLFDSVRIKDGRVVEHCGVPDQLGALQLGLTGPGDRPQPGGPGPEART